MKQCNYETKKLSAKEKDTIIKEYALGEGDTGSPEVQVALLTANINELQAVNFGGETGWIIWTDEEQIEPLIESIR